VLNGELGVSQAFLARWYISGGYMDVYEEAVFYDCGKMIVLCIVFLYMHFCDLKMAHCGRNMSYPTPSLLACNTSGMMHLRTRVSLQMSLANWQIYVCAVILWIRWVLCALKIHLWSFGYNFIFHLSFLWELKRVSKTFFSEKCKSRYCMIVAWHRTLLNFRRLMSTIVDVPHR